MPPKLTHNIYFKVTRVRLSKLLWIIFTSDFFIPAKSVDPEKMSHSSLFTNLKVPVYGKRLLYSKTCVKRPLKNSQKMS